MTSGAPLAVGVDLGTTYTCAAVADGRSAAKVVQLSGSSQTIPSVVSITDDGVIAGEAAERRLVSHPSTTAREFKRRLGDATPIVLGTEGFPAEVLSGHLLREVLDRVEQNEGASPSVVGLAHPASWGPFRLDLLRDAARHAGVEDVVLVPEPVAAAVANRDRVEAGSLVAVYDLGGGTFDAAVVRVGSVGDPDDVTVVGTPEGVERLGGIDFDQAVMAHVDSVLGGQVFGVDRSDPEARSALMRLRSECQAAKEHLSQDSDVDIPVSLPGLQTSVRMTRAEFETAVRPRLADSLAVFDRVAASAGSGWDDIAAILLVGGSSNIPVVAQIVGEHTGRPVVTATSPHLAIAAGTATIAARSLTSSSVPASPVAPATASAATTPTPSAATPTRTPSSGGSKRLALIAGGLAAVAIAVGAVVLLSGGDDSEDDGTATATTDATAGTDDAESDDPAGDPPDDGDDSTDTTEPDSAPETTEPDDGSGGGPVVDLVIEPCTTVGADTVGVLGTDAGSVVVTSTSASFVAGLGPDDCSIDPTGGADVPLDGVGAPTHGTSFGPLFAISTDGGGVVGSTESGASRPCELIVGPVAMTDGGAIFTTDGDGVVTRIRTANGNCEVRDDERLLGITATTVGVAGAEQLALAGSIDDVPTVRVFVDGDTAVELTGVELGAELGRIDAVARCGDAWCVIDLSAQVVHVIGLDASPLGSASLAGTPLDGATAIRSATPTSAGPALVTADAVDGTVAVVTLAT